MAVAIERERRIVDISLSRDIHIPDAIDRFLGFDTQAECLVRGNELVIRPVREESGNEYAEDILEDLISEGYNGQKLLDMFKERKSRVRPAFQKMLEEAHLIATGDIPASTYEDIFGAE